MLKLKCLSLITALMLVFSCSEDVTNKQTSSKEIPQAIIAKLQNAGFDTSEGLSRYKEGYIVEYDIFLTPSAIDNLTAYKAIETKNGRVEHYTSNGLVEGIPRVINVFMDPSFDSFMQNAFDAALARYNAQGLGLVFQRAGSSGSANISVLGFNDGNSGLLGMSAGFPTGGNPASPIQLNTFYYNAAAARADAISTITHEIGHAIGFRHTDFMNRAYSCGSGGNEGSSGVGDVLVPQSPSAPTPGSWMLACSSNTDRPFTAADVQVLAKVYPATGIRDFLNPDEQLHQNQFIRSADGRFMLYLQGDGNLVVTYNNQALWASHTNNKPVTTCAMQGDGNLVLYDASGHAYWASNTSTSPGALVQMQNDGNLVLSLNGSAVWATNTCCH